MENIYPKETILFLPTMAALHTSSQPGSGDLLMNGSISSCPGITAKLCQALAVYMGHAASAYIASTHFIFLTTLPDRSGLHCHFTVMETEEQMTRVACLRSHVE